MDGGEREEVEFQRFSPRGRIFEAADYRDPEKQEKCKMSSKEF